MSAPVARGDTLPEHALPGIGAAAMAAYLAVSGDDNPLHRDAGLARGAGLSGVPVPGMMVLGLFGTLIADWRPACAIRRLGASFAVPVLVETELRLGGRVVAVDETAGVAVIRLTARQGGRVCVMGEAEISLGEPL